ncbi:MAG: hypothetical protein JSS27_13970 [Planctomycetes bacterium]|nr:hypothetical protein [Planctomycetota bacterium]
MPRCLGLLLASALIALGAVPACAATPAERQGAAGAHVDRSPVDLVLTADERFLITANQTSSTLSLIDVASGKVIDEAPCDEYPRALCLAPGKARVLVSCAYAGTVEIFDIIERRLQHAGQIQVGYHPYGVAVSPDGRQAYVAMEAAAKVAIIDLVSRQVARQIDVGRWPRQLALSHAGTRLAVSASGDLGITIIDVATGQRVIDQQVGGINIGQLHVARNDRDVYFPWMIYRQFSITPQNIRQGWVLATRIARVRLDEESRREAISLDVPGMAMSDPHGLALTPDEQWMVCTSSGTHELLAYRMADQKFMAFGGPGDLADPTVWRDHEKFFRVPLGGRPMNLRAARDNRHIYVANYLSNSVQVVDLAERAVVREIALGGPAEPSLARQGEAIFFDARRSLDQWYSCASCHYEGGLNAVPMDTRNDGSQRTYKTVLPLQNVTRTAPWTWHGWQTDLGAAMHKSITDTMLGPEPSARDVKALLAYMEALSPKPNPYQAATAPEAIARGKAIFFGVKGACAKCHSGELYTDGQVHDVGLGSKDDAYSGFNTPSLVGVYERVRLLHDGRCRTLEEVLSGPHNPAQVTGQGELTADEQRDLIEFLKTL